MAVLKMDLLAADYPAASQHLHLLPKVAEETFPKMLGRIQLRQGDFEPALVNLSSAVDSCQRLKLQFGEIYGLWAVCLIKLGRLDEARQAVTLGQVCNAVYKFTTNAAEASRYFAEVFLELGELQSACGEYLQAFRTNDLPQVLGAIRGIGEIRARRGDGPGAAFCFGAVLAHGAAGVLEQDLAQTTLDRLRQTWPPDVLESALEEGRRTPLRLLIQRVVAESQAEGPPPRLSGAPRHPDTLN